MSLLKANKIILDFIVISSIKLT